LGRSHRFTAVRSQSGGTCADPVLESIRVGTREETMIKVGIVGGTGYTGVELLRLLSGHPEADVRAIT